MNRQTKRMMERQGTETAAPPARQRPAPTPRSERTSIPQFVREVRGELRKVGWPTKNEVVNSTIIVLIAVVVMTALIFGLDYVFAKLVLLLFD